MNDFEATASYILPNDPVITKQGKKKGANVSFAKASIESSSEKTSVGSGTGVELRFYKGSEYQDLTAEEQEKL